jgi:RNA polymerase sigma-70 factor (ECF subfamily)
MNNVVERDCEMRNRPHIVAPAWTGLRAAMMRTDFGDADDAGLVDALRAHDDAAMAEIMRRHRTPVTSFARRLTGDAHRADEVAQEVFAKLWERAARFDAQRGTLRSFLLALTHGRALDLVRSDAARRRREERDASRTSGVEVGADIVLEARAVADAVHEALAEIPDEERRAVELAYFGGHSYRTVAQMLDQPEGTVKSRIRNGLARLRTALEQREFA